MPERVWAHEGPTPIYHAVIQAYKLRDPEISLGRILTYSYQFNYSDLLGVTKMPTLDNIVSQRLISLEATGLVYWLQFSLCLFLWSLGQEESSLEGQAYLGPSLLSWEILRRKMALWVHNMSLDLKKMIILKHHWHRTWFPAMKLVSTNTGIDDVTLTPPPMLYILGFYRQSTKYLALSD